jgi:hypothetical protein
MMELNYRIRSAAPPGCPHRHIKQPKLAAVVQRVMHEVQRPHLIDGCRNHQQLTLAGDHPFLRPAWQVQLYAAATANHKLTNARASDLQ